MRGVTTNNSHRSTCGSCLFVWIALCATFLWSGSAWAAIRYVDASATGANTGTSWPDAYVSLQNALAAAVSGDEIWAAAGVYKPAGPGGNRSTSFVMKSAVPLYGGFPPGGGSLDQRDPETHLTILSGDLNGNDGPPGSFTGNGENSYHVVRGVNWSTGARLDGFVIEAGNANGTFSDENDRGGGAYIDGGAFVIVECVFRYNTGNNGTGARIHGATVTIEDCAFHGNVSAFDGGGLYTSFGQPTLRRCTFTSNVSSTGGGAYLDVPTANTVLEFCSFENNVALYGGGGAYYSAVGGTSGLTLTVRNCEFRTNTTQLSPLPPSGLGRGGALFASTSQTHIVNSVFIGNNSAWEGGGVYMHPSTAGRVVNCEFRGNRSFNSRGGGLDAGATSTPQSFHGCLFVGNRAATFGGGMSFASSGGPRDVVNCTVVANIAGTTGGGGYSGGTTDTFTNSIFWDNTDQTGSGQSAQIKKTVGAANINYCCISGWDGSLGGTGNHGSGPQFVDPNGVDNTYGTDDDDLRAASGSPVVDAAQNAAVPVDATDADGNGNTTELLPWALGNIPRFQDDANTPDSGSGTPPLVDMGAYELGVAPPSVTYIGPLNGSWHNPNYWSTGSVPSSQTYVQIGTTVQITQTGAVAQAVFVNNGGNLTINGGTLTAYSVSVLAGGTLTINNINSILDTGSLSVDSAALLQWTAGTLIIDGGGWASTSAISVGCTNSATLIVKNNGTVTAPTLQVCGNGTLSGHGIIAANVTNHGEVSPGASAGRLQINGSFTQSASGVLAMEAGGYNSAVEFDTISVSGQANLNGTLTLQLLPGFGHRIGEPLTLVTASSLFGTFRNTNIPTLPRGVEFIPQYSANEMKLLTMLTQTGPRLYVNASAVDGGDGQSWTTAAPTLQGALEVSAYFPGEVSEIWVAVGEYKPTKRSNINEPRSATFQPVPGVSLFGGFDGTESTLEERDWISNPSVLSGDLNGDDQRGFVNIVDNAYNVVFVASNPLTETTSVDGFVIRAGNAVLPSNTSGGGMVVIAGTPTIRNCTFIDNSADYAGGGLSVATSCLVEHCVFVSNRLTGAASGNGAGARAFGDYPVFRDCWFEDNVAQTLAGGGGLSCGGIRATIVNCTFLHNRAETNSDGGGGLWTGSADVVNCVFIGNQSRNYGAGMLISGNTSSLIANCVFSGNDAGAGYPLTPFQQGAAITVAATAPTAISNCTIASNVSAADPGAAVYTRLAQSSAEVSNSILWGNTNPSGSDENAQMGGVGTLTINYSTVQGWTGSLGGASNNDADPMFVNSVGTDTVVGTIDDDVRLQDSSPAIDSGDNVKVPLDTVDLDGDLFTTETLPMDLDQNDRLFDEPIVPDTGSGTAPLVDRGAYEFGAFPASSAVFIGSIGGSWSVAGNWSTGAVPGAQTDVYIGTGVIVDVVGSQARSVVIASGGMIDVTTGSLQAELITVLSNGTLRLSDPVAQLIVTSLTIQSGGILDWENGTVTVLSSMTSAIAIVLGCNGNATLELASSATFTAPSLHVCDMGTVRGNATISAAVMNDGNVQPGSSVGVLTINGNYTQDRNGSLDIEMEGPGPTQTDRLVVNGTASMAGSLEVSLISAFSPALASSTFLTATSVVGSFDSENLPLLPDSFTLIVHANSTSMSLFSTPPGPRLYVNAAFVGFGQGTSWTSPTPSLALALDAATRSGNISEVWVTQGSYLPTALTIPSNVRSATFQLMNGVAIYGGFAGTEASLEERDVVNNVTILTGDRNGDDAPDFGNHDENVFHVVTALGVDDSAVLDGFSIVGGNTAGAPGGVNAGAGLRATNAGPAIRNCTFTSNTASFGGGAYHNGGDIAFDTCHFVANRSTASGSGNPGGAAAFNEGGTALFQNCEFTDNITSGGTTLLAWDGAAITVLSCWFEDNIGSGILCRNSSIVIDDCDFIGNAGSGADLTNPVHPTKPYVRDVTNSRFTNNMDTALNFGGFMVGTEFISGCTFTGNSTPGEGGAIQMFNFEPVAMTPTISDCSFVGNTAGLKGGAVWVGEQTTAVMRANFTNCTFTNNHAGAASTGHGGAVYSLTGPTTLTIGPTFTNCDFTTNSASGTGGAIRNQGSSMTLDGCTFEGNAAPSGSAIYNSGGGIVRGASAFAGNDEVASACLVAPGFLSPGSPFGAMTIEGAFRLFQESSESSNQAELSIDISGESSGIEHDLIDCSTGEVELAGKLTVSFSGGFQPGASDQFEIIRAATRIGQFGMALFPPMPAGLLMTTHYDSAGVTLKVDPIESKVVISDPDETGIEGEPVAAEMGDVDNDGDLDLVVCVSAVSPETTGNVYVLRNGGNDGQGEWNGFTSVSSPMAVGAGPASLTLGHFDSDLYLDIVVANQSGNSISKFRNNATGDGSFGAPLTSSISSPAAVAAGTFFASWQDVVIARSNGTIVVQSFASDGSLTGTPYSMTSDLGPIDVVVTDIDNDDDDDVLVLNAGGSPAKVGVHLFNSSGPSFATAVLYESGVDARDIHIADLNSDGFGDVVVADETDSLAVLINQAEGNGELFGSVAVPAASGITSIASLDIEPDDDQDIVVVRNSGPSGAIRLARNDLNGGATATFSEYSDLVTGEQSVLVRTGDLNGDGVADIVSINLDTASIDGPSDQSKVVVRMVGIGTPLCPADIAPPGGNGQVGVPDLLAVINGWGPCPGPPTPCVADIAPPGGNGSVGVPDLLMIINSWGMCPQ